MKGILDSLREAGMAAGGVAAAAGAGAMTAAPSWLIAIGQAAVVVVFTVKAIDRRLAKLHERVNVVQGEVEVLRGRFKGLACQDSEDDCPTKCAG